MNERELKVGDRVKDVLKESITLNKIGTVIDIFGEFEKSYVVNIDGENYLYGRRSSLELVESENKMERTSKFKVGDRVRTNKPSVLYKTGSVGKIIGLLDDKCRTINNGELSKEIEFDNGAIDVFYDDSSLDLIPKEESEIKRTSKFKVGEPKNPEPFDFNEFVDETKHLKEDVLRLSCNYEALKDALVRKLDVTIPEMQKQIEQLKADVLRLQKREEEKPKEEVSFFDRFKNPQEMRQFFAEEREKSKKSDILWIDNKSENEYVIRFYFTHPS